MRMDFRIAAVLLTGSVVVAACSGGSSSGTRGGTPAADPDGSLSISLIDAKRWDVDQIWIEIAGIGIKPATDAPAIEFDFDPALQVDLLTLTPANAEILLNNESVPVGAYNWIELRLNADFDNINDSYVVESDGGGEVELRVPSNSVRLVSGFTITANQPTSLMIDWDTQEGLVDLPGGPITAPPGLPGYLLRPAFRIVDLAEAGTLSGTVATEFITNMDNMCDTDDEDLDIGNSIYVFAEFGAVADDFDTNDPMDDPNANPVASIDVTPGDTDYEYSTLMSAGEYTVAFTCTAGLDEPDTDESGLDMPEDDTVFFSAGQDVEILADEENGADFL